MSKRSRRRKRREQQKKLEARLTGPVLAQQGQQAFKQGDYKNATKNWEQALQKDDVPGSVPAALAEAYFRQAVSDPDSAVKLMKQAVKQQPDDPLYRYHLALAHHQAGKLHQAEPIYRDLLKQAEPFTRAAPPLAQLLIDQKKAVLKDPVWEMLTPAQQDELAAAEALIKDKATSTMERLAEADLPPIWQGLLAVVLDDKTTAMQQLKPLATTDNDVSLQTRNVARYYVGLISAQTDQFEAAQAHWQAAKNNGFKSRALQHNLKAIAYSVAMQTRQAGKPEEALEILTQTGPGSANRDVLRQLNWEAGYAAAKKGNWQQALRNWQNAEQYGEDGRRLVFNLALAYQHQEKFWEAAEHWRTLLRRRPRKDDHPDALSDQQVARIWQNVAENYSKAGEYEEAITTYKNALKWAPENLEIRLKLVDALQSEGRWQAAENELNRILDKDPDNVPALVLLAESHSDDYFMDEARELWRRILELEPQHPVARQQLAHTYQQEGERRTYWRRDYEQAIEIYKAGLEEVPDSQRLMVAIGSAYADWGKFDQARDYLEQARALKPNDLQTLYIIFNIWLNNESRKDVEQTLEHLKALPSVPAGLFLEMVERCQQLDEQELAMQILGFMPEKYADDADALVGVAHFYVDMDKDTKALAILRPLIKEHPNHINANIELGLAYFYIDQTRLARRYWDKATELARKNNDQAMLYRIRIMKDELLHGKRAPQSPMELIRSMPPELLEEMLADAPPEIAEMLRGMPPGMLAEMLASFGEFDDDDDFEDDPFAFGDFSNKRK